MEISLFGLFCRQRDFSENPLIGKNPPGVGFTALTFHRSDMQTWAADNFGIRKSHQVQFSTNSVVPVFFYYQPQSYMPTASAAPPLNPLNLLLS